MSSHGFASDTMIYLAAALVCVPLARWMRLGSVLGYVVAGCAIGPWGLRLVGSAESTMRISELGVVLMLFLIGLELDPKRLRELRREVLRGGSLQVAASAVLLALGGLAVGLPGVGAVLVGVALALSSTAIVLHSLTERGLVGTAVGRVGFAILLFQDMAVLPLLIVVPLLAAGGGTTLGWEGPLRALLAVGAVVALGRWVTPRVLQRVAGLRQREVFTGFALLLVLGIAELMTAVGLSMALGTFLAGALLAGSEYRHALESDLEPFRGLLMGLFFIAVGMTIDFGLLATAPWAIATTLLGFLAIKLAVLRVIAPHLGVPPPQGWLFAALMAPGSELAFVVLAAARHARILPDPWEGVLTLTVALSMASMPLLLAVYDRLLTRVPAPRPSGAPTIEPTDIQVIIVGFGRFGQIVGRILFANGLRATVLDHDADQIEFLKRFGFRVFYGDARRYDLLLAAGAATAKVLVVAVDDISASLAIVDLIKREFPHLHIVARARNVQHWLELRRRGVDFIERELFEASVSAGRHTLELLGVARHEAHERAAMFRRHDMMLLEQLLLHPDDEARSLSVSRSARTDLERQFEREHERLTRHASRGWHHGEEGGEPL